LPCGVTNQLGKIAVSQCQRAEWRIEMKVGGMNEPERHATFFEEFTGKVK
jgi:hypothetical protein